MKTFLIQAAAVVLAGAGIGSVAAPWKAGGAAAIPQSITKPQQPQSAVVPLRPFQQAQQAIPGAITVTVTGSPLSGSYTANPTVPIGSGIYMAYLASGNIQSRIMVQKANDQNGITHWYCSAYILNASAGFGGGCSGPSPALSHDGTYLVSSSASLESGMQGHWYGDGGVGGAPGAISFIVTP